MAKNLYTAKANIWQKPIFGKHQYMAKTNIWQKQIDNDKSKKTMTMTMVEHNRISAS
jgi:hypothetical protein